MTLDQVPAGAHVFVDANILVYHFQPHPGFGPMCHRLLERIERQDIEGYTSTNLLGELAHRLMVIEADALPGWGRRQGTEPPETAARRGETTHPLPVGRRVRAPVENPGAPRPARSCIHRGGVQPAARPHDE
jgi:hypothetical protein